MDWYSRRVRSADRKIRAIALLGRKGRWHFGKIRAIVLAEIRAIVLWEDKGDRTSFAPKLL
ncbi:hypothetical protein [Microcoleus sp. K4-C2]|uniref:hypothetical protein n=1 Tax=Microcoleus sp. K4-C2 TaxID=2818792 RepID=UPI002FCF4A8D